jgi:predicted NAD/FAD-binding protein
VDARASAGASAPPHDLRTAQLAPSFRTSLATAARYLGAASRDGVEKRPTGVAARGQIHMLDAPGLPAHAFFEPGTTYPVLLRHDNRTTADDVAPDARVAALRVLDPAQPAELDRSLLDLALLTGRCFFHRSAGEFHAFSIASPAAREAILRAEPHRTAAVWDGMRLGDSFQSFHYHSQTASRFSAADGGAWYARYRLRAPECTHDSGLVDSGGALYAPAGAARAKDDLRSASCLRDAFVAAVRAEGVTYTLQVQLMAAPGDAAEIDRALDCTRAWPQADAPWHDLARLELDEIVPVELLADLEINPVNAPSDLGVIYARSERDSASIDHVRSIVYEASASARLRRPLSPGLRALLGMTAAPGPVKAATIAVVGAGASGLTLARALAKQGHLVTVFEKDAQVGGMCQTRSFEGVSCELGGHMIYPATYPAIVELAKEYGQTLVPDFPDCTVSLESGGEVPRVATADTRAARARIAQLRLRSGALEPGLKSIDRALAMPIADWLASEGLGAIWDWMGPVFVGAGYGYLEDEVPATYLAKSFAYTVDAPGRYRLRDGFQALWLRVAAELRDVRTGCQVQAAVRDAAGVTLTLRGADGAVSTARFDRLVIAHSPASALNWLDVTAEERDLFGRVRHLRYASAIAEVEAVPDALRARWCFVPENTRDAVRRGHITAFVQPDPARPVVGIVAYAPSHGTEPAACFKQDFEALGARFNKLHNYQEWSYFPHFGVNDLRAGAIDRMEALQGVNRTWHASTLLAYELTECAAAYGQAVALRLDHDVRAPGDSSTGLPPRARTVNADSPDAQAFAAFRASVAAEQERVVAYIQRVVAAEFELSELPDPDADLASLDFDSLRAASIQVQIAHDTGIELVPSLLTEAPNLRTLAGWLVSLVVAPEPPLETDDATLDLLEQLNEAT